MITLNKLQIEKVKDYYIREIDPDLPKVLTLNYYTYIVKIGKNRFALCIDDENGKEVEVFEFNSLDDLFFGGY